MKLQGLSLVELNELNQGTLMQSLGIEYTSISHGKVSAKMPVDERTCRPGGIIHGGAYLSLAETLAGLGSSLIVDTSEYNVIGFQVSGNHVRPASDGFVSGTAIIIYEGQQTHVWNIDITCPDGNLVSSCRVVNMIRKKDD